MGSNSLNLSNTSKSIVLHALSWILFYVLVLLFLRQVYPDTPYSYFALNQGLIVFEMCIVFYLNYFFVAPKYFQKSKYRSLKAGISLLALICFAFLFSMSIRSIGAWTLHESITFLEAFNSSIKSIPSIIVFLILSTFICVLKLFNIAKMNEIKLKAYSEKIELEAIKSKINPHFLYNAFNTLYALSEIKSDLISDSILRLSNIVRYILRNSSEQKVSIHKELEFIESYIDFQKLRIENADHKIKVSIMRPTVDFMISPMLLLSFVENAFKYSNLVKEENRIIINFEADKEGFKYTVINDIYDKGQTKTGIGNNSLKKILDIEYQNNHILKTWKEDNKFHGFLHIRPQTF